ncbi:MAG: putative ABC transport system permease protein [Maritalea sp.]|jgi:putative ABC transport system permease protein
MFSVLDKKLVRDLGRMKMQATAIGLVIAVGVVVLVMMDGLFNSLNQTKTAYYDRYRLAEVYAPAVRAPKHLLTRLAAIPGVDSVLGRIRGGGLINLPQEDVPITAAIVSLPDHGAARLNDVYLAEGKPIEQNKEDQVLLLRSFAKAHNLKPGDTISATINGARRKLEIAGLAQSPEFLISMAPGELAPDDKRFAVLWMSETSLGAAFDLKGAFNEALFSLTRDAKLPQILDRVDQVLANFGGTGAYGLEDQPSNRFLSEEIKGIAAQQKILPPIFLAIAAFLLNIVISRMIQSEREQIGLLKAFGYSSLEVSTHYFKFVLAIAIGGALVGCLIGVMVGRSYADLFQQFYKFPFLVFRVDPQAFVIGILVSVFTASAGALFVLRNVFALTPAVAMRPPAPSDYSRAGGFMGSIKRIFDQPTRMVLRRVARHPGRTFGAALGIGAGMGLSAASIGLMMTFTSIVDQTFDYVDRSDMTVVFAALRSSDTLNELRSLEGVAHVEPFRIVPVIMRNGLYSHKGAVTGLIANPLQYRAVDKDLNPITLREDGIIIAKSLAKKLAISPGQMMTIEVQDGERPILQLPIVGIAETLSGAPAYLQIDALNRALKQPKQISGAYLQIDKKYQTPLYEALKAMPVIAGASLKSTSRAAFEILMDQSAGSMRYVMSFIAAIITFGIVYNSARIAFAERARDLASLRVIGFTKGETAFVLLGELAIMVLIAVPIGIVFGLGLNIAIVEGFSTDLYQIPNQLQPEAFGTAGVAVLISSIFSGWMVKRNMDELDLVSALKTRE